MTRSSASNDRDVDQKPAALLEQAHARLPGLSLAVYTAARLAASEVGGGSVEEQAVVIEVFRNRARRRGDSFHALVTGGKGYGRQGRGRPASTLRDPNPRHVAVARAVFRGETDELARGATSFFSPRAQDRLHQQWVQAVAKGQKVKRVHSCSALDLLEAWSFDLSPAGRFRCPPDRSKGPGPRPLEWVGPIAGVDPLRLMLMRPSRLGDGHTRRYKAARAVIATGESALVAMGLLALAVLA